MVKKQRKAIRRNPTKLYHILVVEDKGSDFRRLELALNRSDLDCDLAWAASSEIALELLKTNPFDIILLDFILPDGTGLDLFKEIKRRGYDLPVVFVTGLGDERAAVEAFTLGAQDYLIKDANGEYLNLLPYVIENSYHQWDDSRERKRSENALRELNANLKKKIEEGTREIREREALTNVILSSLEPHIAVLDKNGIIIAVNEAWKQFALDNGNQDISSVGVGANYLEVTRKAADSGDEFAIKALRGLEDVLTRRENDFSFEYPCHSPQENRWYALNVTSLKNDFSGVVTSHTDITSQKIVLNQEKEQRLWAETLQEISSFLNRSLNLETVLQRILEQLSLVVDYDSASVMLLNGDNLDIVAYNHKGSLTQVSTQISIKDLAHVNMGLGDQKPVYIADTSLDPRWKNLPGTEYIKCWVGIPLIAQGKPFGMLNLNHTIANSYTEKLIRMTVSFANTAAVTIENARLYSRATREIEERKRAEAALEEERATLARRVSERTYELTLANQKLFEAMQAKDQFLANMSHELRTPLTAILGKTEVLLGGFYDPLTPKQEQAVRVVESSGGHLLSLINDVLDVAQIEAGQFKINWEKVPVRSLSEASIQMVYEAAEKKGITIKRYFDENVRTIQGDSLRLKQILVNLLNNAVKFTPDGGQIGLEVHGDEVKEIVKFIIWDTGIGISKDGRQRLFGEMNRPKPFYQLENTLSRQYQGSGLGLVLVYTLTAMHNGSIKIESQPGKGTRMTVSLPVTNRIRPLGTLPDTQIDTNYSPLDPNKITRVGQRILLAEDNQHTVEGLVDYLTHIGFEVVVAGDGELVVQLAAEMDPDLIIMDVQLPKRNGLEAIKMIRYDLGLTDVPIIALTALTMPGDRERCLTAGANEYISKPFSLRRFTEVVAKYQIIAA